MVRSDAPTRSLTIAATTATTLIALMTIAAGGPLPPSRPAGTGAASWVDTTLAAVVAVATRDLLASTVTDVSPPVEHDVDTTLSSWPVPPERVHAIVTQLGPRRLDLPPPLV